MIVSHHPHVNVLNKILCKHLQANHTVKSVFTPVPLVKFCTARSLRRHLLQSKLYPFQRTIGSCKCKSPRCQVGKNDKKCYEFSSHVTKKTFKINHYFANSKSLIYLISSKVFGEQISKIYNGEVQVSME